MGVGVALLGAYLPARGEPKGTDSDSNKNWAAFLIAADRSSEDDWRGRNDRIQRVRDARKHLTNPTVSPAVRELQARLPSHDHSVENLLRHAQGWFAQKLPTPKQYPLDPDKPLAAEKVSRWLGAAEQRLLGYPKNVFGQFSDALPADAQGVIKVRLRENNWRIRKGKDEEAEAYLDRVVEHRRANFPFTAEHVDSKSYRPISWSDDGQPSEVIEKTTRKKGPLYEEFGADLGGPVDTMSPFQGYGDTVDFIEYTNVNTIVYFDLTNETVLKVVKHRMKRTGYFVANFSDNSMKDNAFLSEGLADPLVDLQADLESVKETIKAWGDWTALPPLNLVRTSENAMPLKGDEKISIQQMKIIEGVPLDYKVEPVVWTDIGGTMLRYLEILLKDKDELSLAPILMGKMEHALAGPATSAMLDKADSIFGVAETNVRGLFDDLGSFLLEMVDTVLKDDVPVEYHNLSDKDFKDQWIAIGPADIKGYYRCTHQVHALTGMKSAIKQQAAEAAFDRKAIDMQALRANLPEEMMDGATPTEMDRRVRRQEIRNLQMIVQRVVTEAGFIVDEILHPVDEGTPEAGPAGDAGMGMQTINQRPPDLGPPPDSIGMNPAMPPMGGPVGI